MYFCGIKEVEIGEYDRYLHKIQSVKLKKKLEEQRHIEIKCISQA